MTKRRFGFTRIHRDGENGNGLARIQHDPTDTVIEGAAKPQAYTAFSDTSGQFTAGVWACDAGILEIRELPFDELCFVIEGEVEVTDEHGSSQSFSTGDAFILHKGFNGIWRMPKPFRKFNGIFKANS